MYDQAGEVGGPSSSQKRRGRLKLERSDIQRQHAVNESINTLLSVLKYLNQVQDGDGFRIDQTYCKTEMERRTRILNCHEEDIMNASLITMKRLIETLLPGSARPETELNQVTADERPSALSHGE